MKIDDCKLNWFIKFWVNYNFGPQPMVFVSKWSSIFHLYVKMVIVVK